MLGLSGACQGTFFSGFHCVFPCASQSPLPLQLCFDALCQGMQGSGLHTSLCPPAVLLQLDRDTAQRGLWGVESDSTQGTYTSKLHQHLNSSAPPRAGCSTFQPTFQEKAHEPVCHKTSLFCSPGKNMHHTLVSSSQRLYTRAEPAFSWQPINHTPSCTICF